MAASTCVTTLVAQIRQQRTWVMRLISRALGLGVLLKQTVLSVKIVKLYWIQMIEFTSCITMLLILICCIRQRRSQVLIPTQAIGQPRPSQALVQMRVLLSQSILMTPCILPIIWIRLLNYSTERKPVEAHGQHQQLSIRPMMWDSIHLLQSIQTTLLTSHITMLQTMTCVTLTRWVHHGQQHPSILKVEQVKAPQLRLTKRTEST